jgi:hypothetical protein
MAKSKTKEQVTRGQAHAKAAAATEEKPRARAGGAAKRLAATKAGTDAPDSSGATTGQRAKPADRPVSTDIRRNYMKSLLGDYLGKHRGAAAIKPKKQR